MGLRGGSKVGGNRKSQISNPRFPISNFRSQILDPRFQISNFRSQISNLTSNTAPAPLFSG